jgi:hypothetical protein
MKVTKTNTKEIQRLFKVLNEMEWLHKELQHSFIGSVEWDEFEVLSKMGRRNEAGEIDLESFLTDLVAYTSRIHFQRILTNLETLLDNCADPDQKTLEFNPNIAKGLELLQAWVDEDTGRKCEFPVMRVAHADLKRIGESVHSSQCPECTPGTLVMMRDPQTHALLAEDACLYCGQRFVYTDVVEGALVLQEN